MKNKKNLIELINKIEVTDKNAINLAQIELDRKMKPQNSLGVLEDISKKLAGIYGYPLKNLTKKCHIVASADNGVLEEGISSCPVEYTPLVSEAMLNKIAAIGIFSKTLGIDLNIIDIGMKMDIKNDYPNLYRKKVKAGKQFIYRKSDV